MTDVPYKWFFIFLGVCILLRVGTTGQTIDIITQLCDLIPGKQIELKGTFPTVRTANVLWARPGGITISSCTPPNGTCNAGNGFNVSQEMGINYTLLILAADAGRDEGQWEISDDGTTQTANIDLALSTDLTSIQVNYTGPQVISQPSTVQYYKTECVSTNVTLTFILQKDNVSVQVPFQTQSSAQPCTGGFEFTTPVTWDCKGLNGNYTICYVLKSGTCSYTQPPENCTPVQYCPETPTTDTTPTTTPADISTESNTSSTTSSISPSTESSTLGNGSNLISETTDSLTNSSSTTSTSNVTSSSIVTTPATNAIETPCPPDPCSIIAALIVGCVIVVAAIIFLVVVSCLFHQDIWRNGVTVCNVVAAILSTIVIILTATVFDKRDTCTSPADDICIAGSVLAGISAVTLAVAGVICFVKCKLIKGSTVGSNNKPIQMDATGNGKHKPMAS